MPEKRIEASGERQAEKSRPADLGEDQLAAARGAARARQGLIAHELTHATQSGDKLNAPSLGRSIVRRS